jgi:cysteine-rich repeat protein
VFALFTLPSGCAREQHGLTYNTTDVPDSDTGADTSNGMEDTGSSIEASADGGEVGHDVEGDVGTSTTSTSGTASTTGEETTAEPQPVCGNGVVEKFGWVPEECDDGNLISDDGCDDACSADRTMFVSRKTYQPGDFKSLYFADAVCAQAANGAGLANWLKFRAWLSDSKTSARDRFKFSRGRIVLVNGLVVADSWIDLLAGKLQNPIEVTEKGETYHGGVWTGTNPQGVGVPGSTHCLDWTSFSADDAAYYGDSEQITAEWTLSANWDNPFPCLADFAVYCLEER